MIYRFSTYRWQHWITLAVGVAAFAFAIFSVHEFLTSQVDHRDAFLAKPLNQFILMIWALGVPVWFYIEHYLLWGGATAQDLERVKVGRELAQRFWGGVLATLLLLIP